MMETSETDNLLSCGTVKPAITAVTFARAAADFMDDIFPEPLFFHSKTRMRLDLALNHQGDIRVSVGNPSSNIFQKVIADFSRFIALGLSCLLHLADFKDCGGSCSVGNKRIYHT